MWERPLEVWFQHQLMLMDGVVARRIEDLVGESPEVLRRVRRRVQRALVSCRSYCAQIVVQTQSVPRT